MSIRIKIYLKYLAILLIVVTVPISYIIYEGYKKGLSISYTHLGMEAKNEKSDCLKAIMYFSMAIEANHKNSLPYLLMGDCYLELQRKDLALEAYQSAYIIIENSNDEIDILDKNILKKKIEMLKK